jgi:preprotein translocase subunit SecA
MHAYPKRLRRPPPLAKGLDALLLDCVGACARRDGEIRRLLAAAGRVAAGEAAWRDLRDHDLRTRLAGFREAALRSGGLAGPVLEEALAAIREAARRALGLHPFPVQLAGALALWHGRLAEMATGEGKTLTAGLAAVLRAWAGPGVHVITVNDYLAERDADRLRPLFEWCGVKSACVLGPMEAAERRAAYAAGVTYATAKEVLADFLRDRLRLGPLEDPTRRLVREWVRPALRDRLATVQRGLAAAIVDEADSVLIDEAVTPLILSTRHPNPALLEACRQAAALAAGWRAGREFTVEARYREIRLTPAGEALLARQARDLPPLWRGRERSRELLVQALEAREFYRRDHQFLVENGRLVIVDEFTGRPMPLRTWREGMHQAVEAKEGLELSNPAETSARLSFQRFFRLYRHLAGMTGTAWEAAPELWRVYRLKTVRIPTHRPCRRVVEPPRFFATAAAKWDAVVEEIAACHARGRPVLAGTRHVAASEELAARLAARGVPCELLNANRLREEALIVAMAGQPGRVTIATNMAGRGTDIRLGDGVAGLGGLHVIATEWHASGRIDRQLFGRGARQGDPGGARAYASCEDELLLRYLPAARRRLVALALAAGWPGGGRLAAAACRAAQARAQRIAFRQRAAVLRMDTWLDEALAFGPDSA